MQHDGVLPYTVVSTPLTPNVDAGFGGTASSIAALLEQRSDRRNVQRSVLDIRAEAPAALTLRSSSSKLASGAIAGIIVGALAFTLCVVLGIFLLLKARRSRTEREDQIALHPITDQDRSKVIFTIPGQRVPSKPLGYMSPEAFSNSLKPTRQNHHGELPEATGSHDRHAEEAQTSALGAGPRRNLVQKEQRTSRIFARGNMTPPPIPPRSPTRLASSSELYGTPNSGRGSAAPTLPRLPSPVRWDGFPLEKRSLEISHPSTRESDWHQSFPSSQNLI